MITLEKRVSRISQVHTSYVGILQWICRNAQRSFWNLLRFQIPTDKIIIIFDQSKQFRKTEGAAHKKGFPTSYYLLITFKIFFSLHPLTFRNIPMSSATYVLRKTWMWSITRPISYHEDAVKVGKMLRRFDITRDFRLDEVIRRNYRNKSFGKMKYVTRVRRIHFNFIVIFCSICFFEIRFDFD